MRWAHVLDQPIRDRDNKEAEMSDIPTIIRLMQADILREGAGELRSEVTEGKELLRAIGTITVKLFKQFVDERLRANE